MCYFFFMQDDFTPTSFAARLKLLRKRRNLKQKDIAEALGVSQSTIANYEQGIRFPDEETLKSLIRFLTVSADELLGLPGAVPLRERSPAGDLEELGEAYRDSVRNGRFGPALDVLLGALRRGVPAGDIFGRIIEPVLVETGSLWEHGEITAAREHLCTEEIHRHIGIVTHNVPRKKGKGIRCAAAAVGGEMHILGLRMISSLLEIEGYDIFFLGTNTPAAELVGLCIDESIDILALSVTMDYHINADRKSTRLNSSHYS